MQYICKCKRHRFRNGARLFAPQYECGILHAIKCLEGGPQKFSFSVPSVKSGRMRPFWFCSRELASRGNKRFCRTVTGSTLVWVVCLARLIAWTEIRLLSECRKCVGFRKFYTRPVQSLHVKPVRIGFNGSAETKACRCPSTLSHVKRSFCPA